MENHAAERAPHRLVERMVPLRAPQPQPRGPRDFGVGQYRTFASSRARSATTATPSRRRPPSRRRQGLRHPRRFRRRRAAQHAAREPHLRRRRRSSARSCASRSTRSTAPALNGINVCGAATTPDTSVIYMTNNRVARNGFIWPDRAWERHGDLPHVLRDADAHRQHVHRQRAQRSVRRLRHREHDQQRVPGEHHRPHALRRHDGLRRRAAELRQHVVATLYGNTFDSNVRVGIYLRAAHRHGRRATCSPRSAASERGQKNFFRNYAPPKFHAIGCLNVTTNFACPLGGNFFDHSGDDVE